MWNQMSVSPTHADEWICDIAITAFALRRCSDMIAHVCYRASEVATLRIRESCKLVFGMSWFVESHLKTVENRVLCENQR